MSEKGGHPSDRLAPLELVGLRSSKIERFAQQRVNSAARCQPALKGINLPFANGQLPSNIIPCETGDRHKD